ncbi:hypothetical protein ACH4E7_43085 [Kitasatospora sp. NPDC018058]|uniref:hypothetical protein n=1 Tax=Kitasatospora sp. NPDC018058 TaxID=3364025 RepID=UPI0037C0B4A9
MTTTRSAGGDAPAPPRPSGRRLLLRVAWDVLVPIAVYYGLRAADVSVFVALLAGAVLPALTTAVRWLRTRSLEGIAGFIAGTMLLGVAAALVSGSLGGS